MISASSSTQVEHSLSALWTSVFTIEVLYDSIVWDLKLEYCPLSVGLIKTDVVIWPLLTISFTSRN